VREIHGATSVEYSFADQKIAGAQTKARNLFPVTDFAGKKKQWSVCGQRVPSLTETVQLMQDVFYLDQGPNAYAYLSGEAHSSLHRLFATMTVTSHGSHNRYVLEPDHDAAKFLAAFTLQLWARVTELFLGVLGADEAALVLWEDSYQAAFDEGQQ